VGKSCTCVSECPDEQVFDEAAATPRCATGGTSDRAGSSRELGGKSLQTTQRLTIHVVKGSITEQKVRLYTHGPPCGFRGLE